MDNQARRARKKTDTKAMEGTTHGTRRHPRSASTSISSTRPPPTAISASTAQPRIDDAMRFDQFTKLNISDEDQAHFSIYRTEIGSFAIGDALSDAQVFELCRDIGDDKRSLQLLVSHASARVHEPPPRRLPPSPPPAPSSPIPRRAASPAPSVSSTSENLRPETAGYDADLDRGHARPPRCRPAPAPRSRAFPCSMTSTTSLSPRLRPPPLLSPNRATVGDNVAPPSTQIRVRRRYAGSAYAWERPPHLKANRNGPAPVLLAVRQKIHHISCATSLLALRDTLTALSPFVTPSPPFSPSRLLSPAPPSSARRLSRSASSPAEPQFFLDVVAGWIDLDPGLTTTPFRPALHALHLPRRRATDDDDGHPPHGSPDSDFDPTNRKDCDVTAKVRCRGTPLRAHTTVLSCHQRRPREAGALYPSGTTLTTGSDESDSDEGDRGTWKKAPTAERPKSILRRLEDVYERLEDFEDFFPEHDLDKPVIEMISGGTSPTGTSSYLTLAPAPPTPAPTDRARVRGKKSIRLVALYALEVRTLLPLCVLVEYLIDHLKVVADGILFTQTPCLHSVDVPNHCLLDEVHPKVNLWLHPPVHPEVHPRVSWKV
ncbi:hypothetical protein B0H13DRAFT_2345414 [Mycena leptocephala]|nr:hypothetical protein B0H13DRAFT_2349411 [Mycena leptocephala]KAJ7880875.1 hypothetical protein B0H13DRAFT_2345414 [Mycena leptocephala]